MPSSIDFDAQSGQSAKINYSVPLPGQITGKRFMQLDLELELTDFHPSVLAPGQTYAKMAGITKSSTGVSVDANIAARFLRKKLLSIGHGSQSVEKALSKLPELLSPTSDVKTESIAGPGGGVVDKKDPDAAPEVGKPVEVDPVLGDPFDFVKTFAANAIFGFVIVPTTTGGGSGSTEEVPEELDDSEPNPQLFLVEVYGVSSFLGDYGMGRTVRTFTLLPGESTTIRLKTWQSSKESIKQSSSIIDSHEQSAKDRFTNKVQNETTDKKTQADTSKWSLEAEAKAKWGWGSASAKGSMSGEYQSGREQFARSTSEAVGEHANESSSKRELSVTTSTETETEISEETSIERVINNVNMRRVLNFVFRELNQTYTTKVHLKGIYVGFTNEQVGSWRQVPISGLRGLLEEVGSDQMDKDEVAKRILKLAGTVFNANDIPVRVVETINYDPIDDTIAISPVVFDAEGQFSPPTDTQYYRFKQGALAQDNDTNPVEGVLLSEQTIVMRTDSVIVEALLGQADALDNYSMEIQEAAARKETLENERNELLLSTISAIANPKARARAAAALFNTPATSEDA
ncbi:MAG: hypothetical protein H8E29_04370 [Anaerolineales bacterium]|uniref:Uncharacterized protein n=1 Tax=Candidatus Desulfolinea nitratireducens TaxID=2841698 RepID=A0A8J6NIF7_9CHLR|nr:hypothetical protein [Candidatus Desulfolinea nitratireducens]